MISIDSWSVHLVPINPDIKRLLEERESQTLALFTTENGVSPSPSLLINLPLSKFCRVPVHSVSAKTDELELGAAGVISPVPVPPTTESQARHPHPYPSISYYRSPHNIGSPPNFRYLSIADPPGKGNHSSIHPIAPSLSPFGSF